jgi:hypothetical protein
MKDARAKFVEEESSTEEDERESLAEALDESMPAERRGRRKRRSRARARTISIRRLSKAELNRGRELFPETDYWKPKSRSECKDMDRPCPFVSCKYHLYIDVHPVRGSIKLNFPDIEIWEIMNLTRERVRQVETAGLARLQDYRDVERLKDYVT